MKIRNSVPQQQKTIVLPLTPVATVVREQRPLFCWTPFREETAYVVTIYDIDFHEVMKSSLVHCNTRL
ncbi:hypothetical protein L0222_30280 [bacterium]|nr:hypothetical protein [bacterium]